MDIKIKKMVDWVAVEAGDFSSVNEENMNSTDGWYTVMHHAAQQGKIDVVEKLISMGANADPTNVNGTSPAHLAAFGKHEKVLVLLQKAGADFDLVCWGRISVREIIDEYEK